MKLLIIHGPNLNLLGYHSSKRGANTTLDKVNRAIRLHVRNQNIELKILQTHKLEKCLSFIQRRRNWADGIILAPMAWAQYEYTLKETLKLVGLPVIALYFQQAIGFGPGENDSILPDICVQSVTEPPESAYLTALDALTDILN